MDVITLDFESHYSKTYSLSKLTTQEYIDHHLFEVIGVGVKRNDEPTQRFSGSKEETAAWLNRYDWANTLLVAHNALFDASILSFQFGIHPRKIADTLSMARAVHGTEVGGSLAALARHYELGEKGTEVINALGKRRVDFSADEMERYMDYCANDVELTYELFKRLAPHFNKVEQALIDMTIKMHTTPKFLLDRDVLEGHLYDVRARKEQLLEDCGISKEDLMSNPKLAVVLKNLGVEPPMKISARTGKEALAFAKSDEAFKALLEHEDDRVQGIVAARLGVKSTLEETRTERFIAIQDSNGGLPVPLKYYGAITGRWAASDSINLQNLPRGSKLKTAIVAPEGHKIVGADLSNIELRVGLYYAGQYDKVKMLGDGFDLYKDFAAGAFNVAYDEVDDDARFVGKTAQLSLIYGTGANKLRAQCKMLSGKDIGEDFSKNLVSLYRSEYTAVKAAWYDAGKALDSIISDTYTEIGLGKIKLPVWGKRGIKLPSGLFLTYPELKTTLDEQGRTQYVYRTRKGPVHIHPAKCFQNLIQALARCVMGEAMVHIHRNYPIALTIHDAVYCVVPEDEADKALKFIVSELKREPHWAPGLPLDAEGGVGSNLAFKMGKVVV
jgi:DNA polymerase family A/3'-5' exonuclease